MLRLAACLTDQSDTDRAGSQLERIQRLLSIERDARDNAGTRVEELEEMLRQREGLVDTLTQDCQMVRNSAPHLHWTLMCCWQAKEKAFEKVDEMDIQRRQAQILAEQVTPPKPCRCWSEGARHCTTALCCLFVCLSVHLSIYHETGRAVG